MNTTTLRSPYEHLVGEDQDLGEGLSTAELFFWAERKRQQNYPHFKRGHRICPTCKNCLCGRTLSPDFGFRCICDTGKSYVTPYRIRFRAQKDKENHLDGRIYCINHSIYESKGEVCSA